jgi:uncharacterized membrane protein
MPDEESGEQPDDGSPRRNWFEVDRIVAFNDGVFAIAMTLMVFNFRIPNSLNASTEPAVLDVIHDAVPDVLGYLLTFAVLAHYWLAHHRAFVYVIRADRWVLYLNLTLLCFVVVMPFPTLLLQRFGDTLGATVTYAATTSLVGLSFAALWWHLDHSPELLDQNVPEAFMRHSMFRQLTIPIVFGSSILVALINVRAAQFWWLLTIVLFFALRQRYGPIHRALH